MIGTTLSHYQIDAALGAGGMGEVWRAHDTKLGRSVAIKVLPQAFEDNAGRHSRFEREAKVLASLNHPNIATLYGLEHVDGRHILVMELVPGEGLDELLERGPVPLDETIEIACQVAEALDAAHDAGVIHRDLKPANIRIRPDGTVKVLDFGLAKAWESAEDEATVSMSATMTRHATAAGVILGTPAYMSPEQARGKPIDRRTDVWAFGAVLWEMLTGDKLFDGETLSDVLAAVLTREPDWQRLEAGAGAGIAKVLRGCLARDPRERFSSAGDVALLLSGAEHERRHEAAASAWAAGGGRGRMLAAASLLIGLAVGAGLVWQLGPDAAPTTTERLSIIDPEIVATSGITLAPDGSRLAFVVERDDGNLLAVRSLDQFDPIVLPGTEGAMCPFFSPDGSWLGYFTRTELRKVALTGGPPRTITSFGGAVRFDPWNAASYPTADWGDDDTIVFSSGFWRQPATLAGLFTVPASGGEARELTVLDGTELGHRWPSFTPDGRHVVFTVLGSGPRNTHLDVLELASGRRRRLFDEAAQGRVLASGYLVYLDRFYSRLVAAAVDLATVVPRGPAVPLIEGLSGNASQSFAVSQDGTLAYVAAGRGAGESRLVRVGFDGSVTTLVDRSASWYQPRVSPDGRNIVVREVADECRLWLYDLERRTLTPLTSSGDNHQPIWLRSGREVVYGREDAASGSRGIYRQVADGSRPPVLLVAGAAAGDAAAPSVPYPDSFSAGDRELLFEQSALATGSDLWLVETAGGAAQPFLASPAFEGDAAISPDGRWVAYTSDESGRQEVYVRAFPGKGGRQQISAAGGEWPIWSRDGSRLYFSQGRRLMAVAVAGDGSEAATGSPQEVLRGFDLGRGNLDLMPDGASIVLVQPATRGVVEVRVVTGWTRELRDIVPANERR